MKITRIKIQNYKSIVDQTIDSFSQINMLFGHNNSGKSNLLKFIELIFSPKINANSYTEVDISRTPGIIAPDRQASPFYEGMIENHPYIFRNNETESPIIYEIDIDIPKVAFQDNSHYTALEADYLTDATTAYISISGQIVSHNYYTSEIKLDKVILGGKVIYTRTSTGDTYFEEEAGADANGLKANGYTIVPALLNIFNNSVLLLDNDRYFREEKEQKGEMELNHSNFKNWFHNMSLNPERHKEYLSIIKEVSRYSPSGDANFNNSEKNSPFQSNLAFEFGRVGEQIQLILTNGTLGKRFPLESFGTGIQQILYILAKIAEKRPRIVLIEEMELNLSPKYQLEFINHILIKMIQDQNCLLSQLFFTTHSPALSYRTDFQIHKVSIDQAGATSVHKLGAAKQEISEFYPEEMKKLIVEQTTTTVS